MTRDALECAGLFDEILLLSFQCWQPSMVASALVAGSNTLVIMFNQTKRLLSSSSFAHDRRQHLSGTFKSLATISSRSVDLGVECDYDLTL
jgi:hypothetical protein